MKRLIPTVVTFWLSMCVAPAQISVGGDLSTTNRDRIQQFWGAVEKSNGPVTVLALGDSVSESNRSIQRYVFGSLASQFGTAGYTIGNVDNTTLWELENGAVVTLPTTNWWAMHGLLPAGGAIYWTNQSSPTGSILCDQLGVFWVATPDGGSFSLSASTNGGDWSSPLLVLDGYAPAPTGRYANCRLSPQPYRLRIDGLSGTNVIIGPQYLLTTSTGINIAFVYQDGANLNGIFSVSTNVLFPILSALNPQLVLWHMKEIDDLGETGLSNRLNDLEGWWSAAVTNGNIVSIGTPFELNDLSSPVTLTQNRLVRQASVRYNHTYLDCMTPCVSYQSMTNNGFLDDALHPSNTCNRFLATIVWQQLALFALRTDRVLKWDFSDGVARLYWGTAANMTYELQSSLDLLQWTSVETFLGDGRTHFWTNAILPPTDHYFRLSLTQ